MIAIANIIPTTYSPHILSPLNSSPKIHLLLAHQVLKDKNYVSYYSKKKLAGDYIILDNSAFEFGEAISSDILRKAIKIISPNEFVLPDTLFNKDETIKRSTEFIKAFPPTQLKYMGVAQGKTLNEWLSCYECFSRNSSIYSIGLGAVYSPKTIFDNDDTSEIVSGREFLINKLIEKNILNPDKPHHLLGLGDSGHLEIQQLKKYKWIRSCDSSAAYILAKHGVSISINKKYKKIKEKIDFGDKFNKKTHDLLTKNIKTLYESGK